MKKWIERIKRAEKKLKEKHRTGAERAEKHYYNDQNKCVEFPIFHSMIQVQRPALYAQPPNPDIRSRDNAKVNPMSREIGQILEKAISYNVDESDFHSDSKRAVLDYLLCDLGVARVQLDVETATESYEEVQEDGAAVSVEYEVVSNQKVRLDHWPWKRFVYDIGKDWEECDWICYIHHMDKKAIAKEYGEEAAKSLSGFLNQDPEKHGKKTIYEVWDKTKRKIYHITEGEEKPLRVDDDPLKLKGFYDCYKPMISNMRSDKYIPQSEFVQIERQLENINELESKIASLTAAVNDVGFYPEEFTELHKLEKAIPGKLVPVNSLPTIIREAGGMDKIVAKLPILPTVQAIETLQNQKDKLKEQIYEITGLSDIIRGNTKATETATAQQIKGQWASVRLQDKQKTINGWLRGIMRIYAEIIAEHFTAEQLYLMTGYDVNKPVSEPQFPGDQPKTIKEVMQSDTLRCYSIDVETDSTIQSDESQDKQDRMEMIQTILPLLQNLVPAMQQGQIPADLGKSLLVTAVKGYKYARPLEDMVETLPDTMQQISQMGQQLQQGQQQMQQMDMQYQQQLQQAQQMIQQLQNELGKYNQQEEQRKSIEIQAEVGKDVAETKKKEAETAEIWQRISQPQQIGMGVDFV